MHNEKTTGHAWCQHMKIRGISQVPAEEEKQPQPQDLFKSSADRAKGLSTETLGCLIACLEIVNSKPD